MKCFEYHRGGDGFFERSVVHESLKAALVEFFAGEVKPDGAAVVKKVDVEILRCAAILVLHRGVAGCPRRGGSGCRVGRSEGDSYPFYYFIQSFGDGVAVVQTGMFACNVDV